MWIEIAPLDIVPAILPTMSPPIRRCGLKFQHLLALYKTYHVTSHTEVWIEILIHRTPDLAFIVTSHTEVWIEIDTNLFDWWVFDKSPPIRRCGLK